MDQFIWQPVHHTKHDLFSCGDSSEIPPLSGCGACDDRMHTRRRLTSILVLFAEDNASSPPNRPNNPQQLLLYDLVRNIQHGPHLGVFTIPECEILVIFRSGSLTEMEMSEVPGSFRV